MEKFGGAAHINTDSISTQLFKQKSIVLYFVSAYDVTLIPTPKGVCMVGHENSGSSVQILKLNVEYLKLLALC